MALTLSGDSKIFTTADAQVVGVLSSVQWVQRLNTAGGKAPQTGCDWIHQNREVRISYTADYYFWGDHP